MLAGRLASRLGAPRLSNVLFYLAWRADPTDRQARLFRGYMDLRRGRLLAVWKFLTEDQPAHLAGDDAGWLAKWYLLHAEVQTLFRDFQWAEQWTAEAEAITPDDPWLWCVRARTLAAADSIEEALEAAQHALQLSPGYVPAIQESAQRLQQLSRLEDAVEVLASASKTLECGDVMMQLGNLYEETGEYAEARSCYEDAEQYYALCEPSFAQYLACRISDAFYYCGDFDDAADHAARSQSPFHLQLVPRLKSKERFRRVQLPVKFVQQHFVTCAPATLAVLSDYWGKPAEHLDIAEAICYDGTPSHSQRQWAESQGYCVRECRPTWDTAVTLLDRKIPFLLSTSGPGMAHAQAAGGI